jgi:hypothetical protein
MIYFLMKGSTHPYEMSNVHSIGQVNPFVEYRYRETEDGRPKTGARRPKRAGVLTSTKEIVRRRRKTEDRSQKTEESKVLTSTKETEVGRPKSEDRSRESEVGSRKTGVGSRKTEDRRPKTGARRPKRARS